MHAASRRSHVVLTAVLLAVCTSLSAQEICNNGVDDDGDALIDLNDTADCVCSSGTDVESLIPNPSFEDYDCIPDGFSQLSCAEVWEQATAATSDYFLNVEGGLWDDDIPLPVPDGSGVAGFVISESTVSVGEQQQVIPYNEYIGGCLLSTMEAGEEYTIQMEIAGLAWDAVDSYDIVLAPVDITIFGLPTCPPLWPVMLGENDAPLGCPIASDGWIELGHVSYSADGTWQTVTIQFTPDVDIDAIMIGGPCDIPDDFLVGGGGVLGFFAYPYFWIDDTVLNTSASFSVIATSGSLCTDNLILAAGSTAEDIEGYQWYASGVAIAGETDSTLAFSNLNLEPGTYQVVVELSDGTCTNSEIEVQVPQPDLPDLTAEPDSGCPPLTVQFSHDGDEELTCTWTFGDGTTSDACDTEHTYTVSGTYDVTLQITDASGCSADSSYADLVEVLSLPEISFTASPQPATINDTEITFFPESSANITGWLWGFGDVPPGTSTEENPVVLFPALPGTYPVELEATGANGCTGIVEGSVVIGSDGGLNMPTIFSPNGDSDNARFRPFEEFPGDWTLIIWNRWGTEVFRTNNITSGWSGEDASEGTYYWLAEPRNGQQGKAISGYVTLVR
jgi:PKD repeat protein